MRLNLDFESVNIYCKDRRPNLLGVKENGNRCDIKFNESDWDKIGQKYGFEWPISNITLCVYENGYINVITNKYNYRYGEWYEQEIYSFPESAKQEIESDLNYMFFNNNVCDNQGLIINSFNMLKHTLNTTTRNHIMLSF